MSRGPLVSCVLPTRDRPEFVDEAAHYFLRQCYEPRELIVVDSGDRVARLPRDPRVRVIRLTDEPTVGAARNLGCREARGDLVASWDDDDWIGPDRLEQEVHVLERTGADVCGLGSLLAFAPLTGRAWRYEPLADDPPFAVGGSLLFRRSAWRDRPFPDTSVGEDAGFVASFDEQRIAVVDGRWYVAIVHPGNTAQKSFSDPRWSPAPMGEVAERLRADLAFYRTWARSAPAFEPAGASQASSGRHRRAPTPAQRDLSFSETAHR